MSDQDTTITADALRQMLDQFNDSINVRKLASSYTDQVQAFEDAVWPIIDSRNVNTATGDRLDGIGQVVGIKRSGLTDSEYRTSLRAEIAVLQSTGTAEEMLTIIQLLVDMATPDYEVREYYPKSHYMRPVDHALVPDPVLVKNTLQRAISAATNLLFVYSLKDDSATYTLSSQGATTESSSTTGLGDIPNLESQWSFDATSTVLSGLASGDYRLNAATFARVTQIYIHDENNSAADESAWLSSMGGEHLLLLRIVSPGDDVMTFYITAVTDNTGTFTFDVVPMDTVGDFFDNELIGFYEYPSGGFISGAY